MGKGKTKNRSRFFQEGKHKRTIKNKAQTEEDDAIEGKKQLSRRVQKDPARVAAAAASVDELLLPELPYSTSRFPSP